MSALLASISLSPMAASILACCGLALAADLTTYTTARQRWSNDPIANAEPRWDVKLMVAKLALGVITGTLMGLGIGTGNNLASGGSAAQGAL